MIERIVNGLASGDVAQTLLDNDFNLNLFRRYKGEKGDNLKPGQSFVTNENRDGTVTKMIVNAPATLRYDEWRDMDMAVVEAAKPALKFVNWLRAKGLVYNMPNAFGKSVLSREKRTRAGKAQISFDGLARTNNDRPEFIMENLPLPIIHEDFSMSARQLQISRNGQNPLDLTMLEEAGRNVAETAEQLALGVWGSYALKVGEPIYGLTNFPQRLTKAMTLPTASAWTGKTFVTEILDMKQKSMDAFNNGPWVLFTSPAWDQYLDADYSDVKGTATIRERVKAINNIQDVITLDFLTGYQAILLQVSRTTFREVVGMDIRTVQWPTQGGMELNFKVMAILVPQPTADAYGRTGIVHGVAA